MNIRLLYLLLPILVLAACASDSSATVGYPDYPSLGYYWVIDNGCNLDPEAVQAADTTFEKWNQAGIQIVVICQPGIDDGRVNEWLRAAGNHLQLGYVENKEAIIWLIRPDGSQSSRITYQVTNHLEEFTGMEFGPILREAAEYANWGDLDGALDAIARSTDAVLTREFPDRAQ